MGGRGEGESNRKSLAIEDGTAVRETRRKSWVRDREVGLISEEGARADTQH